MFRTLVALAILAIAGTEAISLDKRQKQTEESSSTTPSIGGDTPIIGGSTLAPIGYDADGNPIFA